MWPIHAYFLLSKSIIYGWGVMSKMTPFDFINFTPVFCLFHVLFTVQQTSQLVTVCKKSSTMMQFTFPEI